MQKTFLRWLLPLSLAVNISLATIVGMHAMGDRAAFRPPPPPGPPSAAGMAARMAEDLPKADGDILIAAFKARENDFERGHLAMKTARDSVQEALAGGESDPEKLIKVFDGVRQARDMFDNALAAAMAEAVSKMSPEGRRKISQLKLGPPPPPGGGGPPPPR